jgi:hypothetical protein
VGCDCPARLPAADIRLMLDPAAPPGNVVVPLAELLLSLARQERARRAAAHEQGRETGGSAGDEP